MRRDALNIIVFAAIVNNKKGTDTTRITKELCCWLELIQHMHNISAPEIRGNTSSFCLLLHHIMIQYDFRHLAISMRPKKNRKHTDIGEKRYIKTN